MQRRQGNDVLQYACGDTDSDEVSFFVVHTDATYQGEPVTNESFPRSASVANTPR
jgi:hypothetical protein